MFVAKAKKKANPKTIKTRDFKHNLTGKKQGCIMREELWQRSDNGEVVKYNLAYINHRVFGKDNGRVLGYDNSHGYHHRHFMGTVEQVEYTTYDAIAKRFRREVTKLWEEGK